MFRHSLCPIVLCSDGGYCSLSSIHHHATPSPHQQRQTTRWRAGRLGRWDWRATTRRKDLAVSQTNHHDETVQRFAPYTTDKPRLYLQAHGVLWVLDTSVNPSSITHFVSCCAFNGERIPFPPFQIPIPFHSVPDLNQQRKPVQQRYK